MKTREIVKAVALLKHPGFDYLLVCTIGIAAFLAKGLDLPLARDNALYFYSAQQLVDGIPPYQSIFDIKTPLTSFVTALGILLMQPFSENELLGVRILYIFIGILTLFATYAFAWRVFKKRSIAIYAAIFYLTLPGYTSQVVIGARPKVLLLLFYTLSLICMWDKKWISLGFFAALCALTWQPSGIVIIAAIIFAIMQKRSQIAQALVRLTLGVLIPTALLAGYFIIQGAFHELLQGTLLVHTYLQRHGTSALVNLWASIPLGFCGMSTGVLFGLLFFILYSIGAAMKGRDDYDLSNRRIIPILLVVTLFLLASSFDYQGYVDFFVFLPYAALGFSFMCYFSLHHLIKNTALEPHLNRLLVIPFVLFCLSCVPHFYFQSSQVPARDTIHSQRRLYRDLLQTAIGEYDESKRVVILELTELAPLTGIRNATPYLSHIFGVSDFVASNYAGGYQGWVNSLDELKPDLIVLDSRFFHGFSRKQRRILWTWCNGAQFERGPTRGTILTWVRASQDGQRAGHEEW